MTRHHVYEELAAGYALDALDPSDEASFVTHLGGCARCAADLVHHRVLAADLALAVDAVDPTPFPKHLFRGPQDVPAPVLDLGEVRARRDRARLLTAAAAAVVLAAAVGSAGYLVGHHGRGTIAQAGLGTVGTPLVSRDGQALGELSVTDGRATLTTRLPDVKPQGRWYVVWDLHGGKATAVKGFRANGSASTIPLGAWRAGDTAAVSLESDGRIPAAGTTMVLTPSVLSSS
jgi:anti-sigma factor RsiW